MFRDMPIRYVRQLNELHKTIYGTPGKGTWNEKMQRVLQKKDPEEIFSFNDETKIHPRAVTLEVRDWGELGLITEPNFLKVTDVQTLHRLLDYFESSDYQIPIKEIILYRSGIIDNRHFQRMLDHPYWDSYHDELKVVSGHFNVDSEHKKFIDERINFLPPAQQRSAPVQPIKALDVDTLTLLVMEAQQTGNLSPLKEALQNISFHGDKLANRVLTDVNAAYRDVRTTFWEVREFVNAISPGSYPYPNLKRDAVPLLSAEGLKRIWDEVRGVMPKSSVPSLNISDQYSSSMRKTDSNAKKIDQAVISLYALNRLGEKQADVLKATEDAISSFVGSDEGKAMIKDGALMQDILLAEQSRLTKSRLALEYVTSFTNGMARRIIPLGETLSATMNSITVTMTLQTAKSTIDDENYRDVFYNAVVKMADASAFITSELAARAPMLQDTGVTLAADLIEDATKINDSMRDYRARLKESKDPTTALITVHSADFGGGPA